MSKSEWENWLERLYNHQRDKSGSHERPHKPALLYGSIEGQRDLVAIAGQSVIPPGEEKFYPALESLRWRAEHLVAAY